MQADRIVKVETMVERLDARATDISQLKTRQERQESKILHVEKLSKSAAGASIPGMAVKKIGH